MSQDKEGVRRPEFLLELGKKISKVWLDRESTELQFAYAEIKQEKPKLRSSA